MWLPVITVLFIAIIALFFVYRDSFWIRLLKQLGWGLLRKIVPWPRPVAILGPNDATPALMSAALQERWPGVQVTSVSHVEVGGDQGSSGRVFRLKLQVNSATTASGEGVPQSVMLKLPKDTFSQAFMEVSYVHESELSFYETTKHTKTTFPIPTPFPILTGHTKKGGFWFLLMDDVLLRPGCDLVVRPKFSDVENVKIALSGLAAFHAEFWESPRLQKGADFGWLRSNHEKFGALPPIIKQCFPKFVKTLKDKIPADVANRGLLLLETYPFVLELLSRPPLTLCHGDATPINGFFLESGDSHQKIFGLYDWQVCVKGKAMFDVALLLDHVPQEVVEKHEDALLHYYFDELHRKAKAASVTLEYSYEQALDDYKLGWALTFLRNLVGFSVVPLDNAAANIYYQSMTLAAAAVHRWKIIDEMRARASAAGQH